MLSKSTYEDVILNSQTTQASSSAFHAIDRDAARRINSPLTPVMGGAAHSLPTPERDVSRLDINFDPEDSDDMDEAECPGAAGGIVSHLRGLLGVDVVLLPIPSGQKGPITKGWQTTTVAKMSEPAYLESLARGNIGVLLGAASGGVCTIDIDSDEGVEPFLALQKPEIQNTLRTKRMRGCNLWLRITGACPTLAKLKTKDGNDWGEWRGDGGQTVVHGQAIDRTKGETEPTKYRIVHGSVVADIRFEDIVWPEDWTLPWRKDPYEELVAAEGQPFHLSSKGRVVLNEPFYVAKYMMEHRVIYEAETGRFFDYEDGRGLWSEISTETLKRTFLTDLKNAADHFGCPEIIAKRTNGLTTALTDMLRGYAERTAPFQKSERVIHAANGMLHLDGGGCELRPFSHAYYSRNQSPIAYEESATCPRFVEELLGPALDPDDIRLLQRLSGQILLGDNPAQVIGLIHGTGGSGKGTFVEVIEGVTGRENVAQVRTKHLEKQFEIASYVGKSLLCGRDVPGNFLNEPGAQLLKSLVGRDLLDAELKGGNKRTQIMGTFNVLITSNSRLRVKLDGDVSAWRRRLLIVQFNRQTVGRPIPNFAQTLLRDEGSGILNWMIAGAQRLLCELREHGSFQLTAAQSSRVEDLLCESDSVRDFVRNCVVSQPGHDVTSQQLVDAYNVFCSDRGWTPQPQRLVCEQLVDAMLDIHRAQRATDIGRSGRNQRGYRAVRLQAHGGAEL